MLRTAVASLIVCFCLGAVASAGEISARGSDSTISAMKLLAEAFNKETGKSLKVEGGGSGAGVKACLAGEVDLAFLSRELKDDEKKSGLAGVPYAFDAVAVVVHKENPTEKLSLAELKDIFTAKTTTWSDSKPIILFNRNADSGTRECFQHVVLKEAKFSETAAVKHDAVLLPAVSKIPTSVGFDSASVAHETVKVLAIDGVLPSEKTIQDKSYPICRTLTLATKGEAAGDVKAFIDFATSDKGQAVVKAAGFVALK